MEYKSDISVVIPVLIKSLDDLRNLHQALNSILVQTMRPNEVILSIDKHDFSAWNIAETLYFFKDLKIVVLFNSGRPGISENTNNGLMRATGRYIHILHQDDIILNVDTYEMTLTKIDSEQSLFAIFTSRQLNRIIIPEIDIAALVGYNRIGGPSSIFFMNLKEVFFDSNLAMLCDVDFVFTLRKKFGTPTIIYSPSIEYGISEGQAHRHISREDIRAEVNYILSKFNVMRIEIFLYIVVRLPKKHKILALDCLIESINISIIRNSLKIIMKTFKFVFHS